MIEEGYLDEYVTPDFEAVDVPVGEVFLLSDNRLNSVDSRRLGPIPREDLVGSAFVSPLPIHRILTILTVLLGVVLAVVVVRAIRSESASAGAAAPS